MKTNHQAQRIYRMRMGAAIAAVLALTVVEGTMALRFGRDCGCRRTPQAVQNPACPPALAGCDTGWANLLAAK